MHRLEAQGCWCFGTRGKPAALWDLCQLAAALPPGPGFSGQWQLLRAEIQADIMAAGAAPALVRLLCHRSSAVHGMAMDVLCELMRGSEPNKADIVAAGAVPALVRLLGQSGRRNIDARYNAASALRWLVAGSGVPIKAAVVAGGAVPALVQALGRSGELFLAANAAAALRGLAAGGEAMKAAIAAAGPALVQLLTSRVQDSLQRQWAAKVLLSLRACSGGSQAAAARSDSSSGDSSDTDSGTVSAGTVTVTHELIRDPVAAAAAVLVLVQLLDTPSQDDEDMVGDTERAAASAVLSSLAGSSEPNPAALSQLAGSPAVSAGTATQLVQLLGDSRSRVQQAAAAVLRNLAAGSQPNKAVIAATGAAQALRGLLEHSSSDVQSAAAGALRNLEATPSFTKGINCR